jgi:hypothetical protein
LRHLGALTLESMPARPDRVSRGDRHSCDDPGEADHEGGSGGQVIDELLGYSTYPNGCHWEKHECIRK